VACVFLLGASATTAQTPEDPRTGAERALAEGLALKAQAIAAANAPAMRRLEESARLWRELGEPAREAQALEALGALSVGQNVPRAQEVLTSALARARQGGDRAREASVLVELGAVHVQLAEVATATERFEAALALARELGDEHLEARALGGLGNCYRRRGEPDRAVESLREAVRLCQARGDRVEEANSLSVLALVDVDRGQMQEAFETLRRALEIREETGDRSGEALTRHSLGWTYETTGDYTRALEYYEQALALHRALGNLSRAAKVLASIGWIHYAVGYDEGDDAQGLAYFRQATAALRETGDRLGLIQTLNSTSALLLRRKDVAGARSAAEEAMTLARQAGIPITEANQSFTLARVRAAERRDEEARTLFNAAIDAFRAAGSQHTVGDILCELAQFLRDRGQLEDARARIEEAIGLLEDERSRVASEDLRNSYLESHRYYYNVLVDVLMALHARQPARGLDSLAFDISERARARGLLETLAQAALGGTEGIDPALLQAEREGRSRISAKERERMELVAANERGERLALVERELRSLVGEYHDIQERLRRANPAFAALTLPEPLSIGQIQQQVLDDESLLLEYAIGEDRAYVWAVTRDAVRSHELPASRLVEAAARRVRDTFAQSNRRAVRGQAEVAARELSRIVLGPVADLLGGRRLVVVAEGALQYVPIGALPAPSGPVGAPPLIASREVVYLPSASSLALLRGELAGRARAPRLAAVLSDPVFRADDPRIRAKPAGFEPVPAANQDLTRATSEAGIARLERLPFSRREAQAISRLASSGAVRTSLDFAASRATATDPSLRDFRIVHFATHALVNSRYPELSGIVLSLVDEGGGPQDGFLRLSDLYGLKLGADLAVLSACQTALGKTVKGEGLIGLTRGFFYAGVPRVIASLWSVRDEATAELMARLYRAMLERGESPAAALRAAQLSLRQDARWGAPYYWAGFVLQGEWRP
jgi:CHAT domain-containing protein/tetratricopeptide (TPR) repeat protein